MSGGGTGAAAGDIPNFDSLVSLGKNVIFVKNVLSMPGYTTLQKARGRTSLNGPISNMQTHTRSSHHVRRTTWTNS